MVLREDQLLVGLDPQIKDDSDSWPEFTLTEAFVESREHGKASSLLNADHTQPVRMNGVLELPNRSDSKYCTVSTTALSLLWSNKNSFVQSKGAI